MRKLETGIGIYKITNLLDGWCYIGQSINFRKRLWRHKNELIKNKHDNTYLQRAVNKYGIDNFEFEVMETCDKHELTVREQFWLDSIKNKYNLQPIANTSLGSKWTPEAKLRYSERRKQEWEQQSEEERQAKLKELSDARKKVPEHRYKVIYQYDLEGNFIDKYPSLQEASRITGIPAKQISNCANGWIKTSRNFIWKKEEDNEH